MPNIDQYYQNESDYLKAADLKPGQKAKLTITGNSVTEFTEDNNKKQKIALEFAQTEKKWILNKTNATTIAHVYGNEVNDWSGKDIFIFSTKVTFGDKMVPAIRVEMPLVEGSIQPDVSIKENTPAEDFQSPTSASDDFQYDQDIPF